MQIVKVKLKLGTYMLSYHSVKAYVDVHAKLHSKLCKTQRRDLSPYIRYKRSTNRRC